MTQPDLLSINSVAARLELPCTSYAAGADVRPRDQTRARTAAPVSSGRFIGSGEDQELVEQGWPIYTWSQLEAEGLVSPKMIVSAYGTRQSGGADGSAHRPVKFLQRPII